MFKLVLSALALFAVTTQAAELRVLENYNPKTKTYTGVVTSTTEKPLSITTALSPANGLCYKGALEDVVALLSTMVTIYNAEQSTYVMDVTGLTVGEKANGPIGIYLTFKSQAEIGSWEWTSVPACVR